MHSIKAATNEGRTAAAVLGAAAAQRQRFAAQPGGGCAYTRIHVRLCAHAPLRIVVLCGAPWYSSPNLGHPRYSRVPQRTWGTHIPHPGPTHPPNRPASPSRSRGSESAMVLGTQGVLPASPSRSRGSRSAASQCSRLRHRSRYGHLMSWRTTQWHTAAARRRVPRAAASYDARRVGAGPHAALPGARVDCAPR